ncbi:MAG: dihydrofolate reductase family protein [Actinomycetota bacterium]|nr:dihydrofolate reductase family protein [Actinomycetota bacterium]
MRKLIVSAFVTLDGVVQAPGGPGEDDDGGFTHGGWTVPHFDDHLGHVMGELMGKPFDLVLGRKTYDIFASYWPTATEEEGAKPLNDATKHVASRGKPSLEWERSFLIEGDVAEGVAALKEQEGPELQVHGSGNLVQTLLRHGLVDEWQLLTFPVVLGAGKRLFGDGVIPTALRLAGSSVSGTGVLVSRYVTAGDVLTGS